MSDKMLIEGIGTDYLTFMEMQEHLQKMVGSFNPYNFMCMKSCMEFRDDRTALLRRISRNDAILGHGSFLISDEIFACRRRFSRVLTTLHSIVPAYYALNYRPIFASGVIDHSIFIKRSKIGVMINYSKFVDDVDPQRSEVEDHLVIGMDETQPAPSTLIVEDEDFAIHRL